MTTRHRDDGTRRRYEVLELLGQGGMATVYQVRDPDTGQVLALKRLHALEPAPRRRRARTLFEREFHTLSQLAHPRVVRVLDYGIDDEGPYYTMELLEGGDLQARAPMPWQQACVLMRDVCSVLALLHSRQMLHRDLSPRNVRCTPEGRAKLFDFGAMTPMGWARDVAGTPTVCAPEVLNQQRLDGRADLFSLGCTLYFAITGSHAFPARDFAHLPLLWGEGPAAPSTKVDAIPRELDALVMGLLQVDPAARPGSAGEVMARLEAIAALPADEQLPVPQAYLSSPQLVGRDRALGRARKKIDALVRYARGGALLVCGRPGMGRSRLLDAALLQARFRGAVTLRADAADARLGELGTVWELTRQLLRAHHEMARSCAEGLDADTRRLLTDFLAPASQEGLPPQAPDEPTARSRLQQALRRWLCAVAERAPLVIGFDDLDQTDAFSEAFAALLAYDGSEHALLVIATAESASFAAPLEGPRSVLQHASTPLSLGTLSLRDTESLLHSIFGEAHHIASLARTIHEVSGGLPRDLMAVLRHLVAGGTVHYAAGAWSVPLEVDPSDVPASISHALEHTASSLDADSLALARGLALAPELRLEPEQLLWLTDHQDLARLMESLDRLLLAGVVRSAGNALELSQAGWIPVLLAGMEPTARRNRLLRVADAFARLDDAFRSARYLLDAGETERGLRTLIEFSRASLSATADDPGEYMKLIRSLPADWLQTFERGFALCRGSNRSRQELLTLYERSAGIAAGRGGEPGPVRALLEQMVRATGLDRHAELSEEQPSRLAHRAMQLASDARANQAPERRLPTPEDALPILGRAYLQAIGCAVSRLDIGFVQQLPAIGALSAVSPVLAFADRLREGVRSRLTGRSHRTRAIYEELLRRAAAPDRAGLDRTHHETMVNAVRLGLGLMEGSLGSVRALALAQELAENPVNEVNAVSVRMVFHLWQGDAHMAEQCRRQAELLRIEGGDSALFVRRNLAAELPAFAAMDDLSQLRQSMPTVSRLAIEVGSWQAIEHYARGEYDRIRGALPAALEELRRASELTVAGQHLMYCEIQAAYVSALLGQGQIQEALAHGQACLERAEAADLDHKRHLLELRVALALAQVGRFAQARALADQAADGLTSVRAGKLLCGLAAETSARIAVLQGDQTAFDDHLAECGELYKAHDNRALHAKHARLVQDARRQGLQAEGRASTHPPAGRDFEVAMSTVLSACTLPQDRAARALDMMCEQASAVGGSLFMVERGRALLVAEIGTMPDADALQRWASARLDQQAGEPPSQASLVAPTDADPDTFVDEIDALSHGSDIRLHATAIAHRDAATWWCTGMAVFAVPADRPFRAPDDTAAQLSRHWHETGEADSFSLPSH